MFGGKFGLNKFSLGKEISDINVRVTFSDSLKTLAGFGENIPLSENYHAVFNSDNRLTIAVPSSIMLNEKMNTLVSANANIIIIQQFTEEVSAKASIVENIGIKELFEDGLRNDVYISKDIHETLSIEDSLMAVTSAAKDIYGVETVLSGILMTLSGANVLDKEIIAVDITLQPGDILQINSDNFTILLNGKNAIHLQRGDWIELDRNLIDLFIDSGTGGSLNGKLLFHERFL